MGALRTRMSEEMKLRNFSSRTQQSYLASMIGLVKHYRRSPDDLTQDEIRAYLLHLEKRGLSPSSRNVAISGMKFFYHRMLGWDDKQLFIPPRRRSWQLPEVLGQKEVERLLLATTKQRDRCLLMTAYATGLRVSEWVGLKVSAIDSERMMVRVEQGKGRKDRYTVLSPRLLTERRSYWKEHRSPIYLFPNRKGGPISIDYAQRIYNLAKQKAQIHKGKGIHTLRHCFATHLLEAGVGI
ncbi:MAG: tyrosine-type recombinase/integrase [Candidatus Binatia bacterium]